MDKISLLLVRFTLAYLLLITSYVNLANYPDVALYSHYHGDGSSLDLWLLFLMTAYFIGALFLFWGRRLCITAFVLTLASLSYASSYYAEFGWVFALGLAMLAAQLLIQNTDNCRDRLIRTMCFLKQTWALHHFHTNKNRSGR